MSPAAEPHFAITCGGTGGHLFPGMAVGRELIARGCSVSLLISAKAVDQLACHGASDFDIITLPVQSLERAGAMKFLSGSADAFRLARDAFKKRRPAAVLGMGSFTSLGPMLAAKSLGIRTFIHEANAWPGKANRYLAPLVQTVFLGSPDARARVRAEEIELTGTPIREEIVAGDPAASRMALGLDPRRDTLLIMGGSQGSRAVNELLGKSLSEILARWPDLQFIHLAGPADLDSVRAAYDAVKARALVAPFLTEINYALNAATVCIARSGASSMAELAAVRLPTLFVPLPSAADDHQTFNAHAFVRTGAALSLAQREATPAKLISKLATLLDSGDTRRDMQLELAKWQFPNAAAVISERLLDAVGWESTAPEDEMLLHYQAQLRKFDSSNLRDGAVAQPLSV